MNKIRFQAGMSLHKFLCQYGMEEQCEAALYVQSGRMFALRWKALLLRAAVTTNPFPPQDVESL